MDNYMFYSANYITGSIFYVVVCSNTLGINAIMHCLLAIKNQSLRTNPLSTSGNLSTNCNLVISHQYAHRMPCWFHYYFQSPQVEVQLSYSSVSTDPKRGRMIGGTSFPDLPSSSFWSLQLGRRHGGILEVGGGGGRNKGYSSWHEWVEASPDQNTALPLLVSFLHSMQQQR